MEEIRRKVEAGVSWLRQHWFEWYFEGDGVEINNILWCWHISDCWWTHEIWKIHTCRLY